VRNRNMIRLFAAGVLSLVALSACAPLSFAWNLSESLPNAKLSVSPAPEYYSPLQGAQYVSKAATIIIRYGPLLTDEDLGSFDFAIQGSRSGAHSGQIILADDHRTVIFRPDVGFTPGEKVAVEINALQLDAQTSYPPISYAFTVAINQRPGTPGSSQLSAPPIPAKPPRSAFPDFLTVPQDIPHFTLSRITSGDEDIFVAPFYWTESTVGSYLLILNTEGQLVYYRSVADALDAWDFKKQPNGLLSYYDQKNSTFHLMDSHYQPVDSYQAGDGYAADLHDFQILPNGNVLLMVYDAEQVDMSKVVLGGKRAAMVTGLIIQELDPSRNVIFEWRSWDHFLFHDSAVGLTNQDIDLVHANSLALANDGNLLLSSRNLSEITKIDLKTGDVIWRLGGRANMFTFVNGEPFANQHDVRQLPNGNITVFDNHGTPEQPAPSRGVEYQVDELKKTVSEVWSFTPSQPVFGTYLGNTQRLPNGNTLLTWGAPYTKNGYNYLTMTEVTPENHTLFELTFDQPYVSYRAFLFPWQGFPDSLPALAYKHDGGAIVLGYSWNGATEVAGYDVYGGNASGTLRKIEYKLKTDFETQSRLDLGPNGACYFQVAARDKAGNELARSRVISTDGRRCAPIP
jgi:hypothetical protein